MPSGISNNKLLHYNYGSLIVLTQAKGSPLRLKRWLSQHNMFEGAIQIHAVGPTVQIRSPKLERHMAACTLSVTMNKFRMCKPHLRYSSQLSICLKTYYRMNLSIVGSTCCSSRRHIFMHSLAEKMTDNGSVYIARELLLDDFVLTSLSFRGRSRNWKRSGQKSVIGQSVEKK